MDGMKDVGIDFLLDSVSASPLPQQLQNLKIPVEGSLADSQVTTGSYEHQQNLELFGSFLMDLQLHNTELIFN